MQCELHFEFQVSSFPTERSQIAYIISHLSGRAEAWAMAEWNRGLDVCNSLQLFTKTFTQIFQVTSPGWNTTRSLVALLQGKRRFTAYAIEFRTLATKSGWNQSALSNAFLNGLSETLKDHIVVLDWMVAYSIRLLTTHPLLYSPSLTLTLQSSVFTFIRLPYIP